MANPNIKNPTGIYGDSVPYVCTTTLAQVVANAAASGTVVKVNLIRATNVTGTAATIDISLFRTSTHTYLTFGAQVLPQTTVIAQNREEYWYLEEGDALFARASSNATVHLIVSFEVMS